MVRFLWVGIGVVFGGMGNDFFVDIEWVVVGGEVVFVEVV